MGKHLHNIFRSKLNHRMAMIWSNSKTETPIIAVVTLLRKEYDIHGILRLCPLTNPILHSYRDA